MKKLLCTLFSLIWLLSALPAVAEETSQTFTIRGDISFGLSIDEVEAREDARELYFFHDTLYNGRDYYTVDVPMDQPPLPYYLVYGFNEETGSLEEIIYMFSDMNLTRNADESSIDSPAGSDDTQTLEDALMNGLTICNTLEAKYGTATEVEYPIATYLSYGFTQIPDMSTHQIRHYLVEDGDMLIVIEALVLHMPDTPYSAEEFAVYVTYEQMSVNAYNHRMNEHELEVILNSLL